MTLDDVKLEAEIAAAQYRIEQAPSHEIARVWFVALCELVKLRRPEYVVELERMRGLRP